MLLSTSVLLLAIKESANFGNAYLIRDHCGASMVAIAGFMMKSSKKHKTELTRRTHWAAEIIMASNCSVLFWAEPNITLLKSLLRTVAVLIGTNRLSENTGAVTCQKQMCILLVYFPLTVGPHRAAVYLCKNKCSRKNKTKYSKEYSSLWGEIISQMKHDVNILHQK